MTLDKEKLAVEALEYAMLNQQSKLIQARMKNVLRPSFEGELIRSGEEDISGHKHLKLPNGIEVIREKRAPITFHSAMAEVILSKKDLLDACSHMERVLEEDKIMEAYEQGLISPQEFDMMFSETVTWALKVNVDKTMNPDYADLEAMRKEEEAHKPIVEMPEVVVS